MGKRKWRRSSWGGAQRTLPASCGINKILGDCDMVIMSLFEEDGKPELSGLVLKRPCLEESGWVEDSIFHQN